MLNTVRSWLNGLNDVKVRRESIRHIVDPLADRYSTQALNSAGLVIKAGGSALAKTGSSDFYASVKGILVKIAASTDMPALTGLTITAASFNVACFFVDSAGTRTVAFGTEGTTVGLVTFPIPPFQKAMIGFLIITYASTFTGGTTPLDTATTVYINAQGPFDPSVLVS